jgi:peptide-N4-(N-acetyl-beta-glucosaminyl)asparagine amidase
LSKPRLGSVPVRSSSVPTDGKDVLARFGVQHRGDNAIGGDGLAFVLRNTLDPVQVSGGAGLGYEGIPNSLAVEFDTWWNDLALLGFENRNDPNGNHISVQTRGTAPNSADHLYSRGTTTAIPNLSDGNVHTVTITYLPGTMRIFLDNPVTPVLEVAIDISTILNLDDGNAFVGFVASTGSSWENHDILRWSFMGSR